MTRLPAIPPAPWYPPYNVNHAVANYRRAMGLVDKLTKLDRQISRGGCGGWHYAGHLCETCHRLIDQNKGLRP